jgi:uncharacterized membrane protein
MLFSKKTFAYVILALGLVGLIDSFFLVIEYFAALETGGAPTPCSPSSMVSCTKTVQGEWARLLGVPNPLFGMMWYGMATMYGLSRVLGSEFSRSMRMVIAVLGVLGLIFSYALYFGSVIWLRGVCPFCLLSTFSSSIIGLAFVLDDRTYTNAIVTNNLRKYVYALQIFFVAAYSIGLTAFLVYYMPMLVNPMEAVLHWSFPVIILLIVAMVAANVWVYKALQLPLPTSKKDEHSSLFKKLFRI